MLQNKGVGLDLKKKNSNNRIKNKKYIKKLLVIGVYKKSKGYIELLKIAEILNKEKFKIDCYGYGDFQKLKLLKIKKKLKNISFKKFDKNLNKKIKHYDLLLHLSKREGLPVSVMQCLRDGVPVICNKIRGNVDLIKNGSNGFFVNSYKDVPNLIYSLDSDNKKFNKIRKNAIKSITNEFSKKKINQMIYKIIKKNFIKKK